MSKFNIWRASIYILFNFLSINIKLAAPHNLQTNYQSIRRRNIPDNLASIYQQQNMLGTNKGPKDTYMFNNLAVLSSHEKKDTSIYRSTLFLLIMFRYTHNVEGQKI